ncbi:diguanylate cyclase [Thalassotalea euphylliae]|uniref:sensor domain-containing diguanylate cyclase n=1 Tax=Thalassotalea euphylliae TaxID=1655234 RepID=UPI0036358517
MNTAFKPWQYNAIICVTYFVLAVFTMQVLKTLAAWPPAGVALAGVMIFGRNAWIGIAIGTFLVVTYHFHLVGQDPFALQHLIINASTTAGNTLAALCAYWVINKKLLQQNLLTSVAGLANIFIVACIAIGLVSALFGVGIYYVVGLSWFDGLYMGILNWTISNALAAIVIAPALYFLWQGWPHKFTLEKLCPVMIVTMIIVIICYLVFGPSYAEYSHPILQPALLLFPLLYSAIKLSPTSTCCMNVLIFFLAWIGSNQGKGYFFQHHPETAEVSMQYFFLFTLSAMLLVQAVFIQRRKEQNQLTSILEHKVEERTKELEQARQEALALSLTDPLTQIYNRRGFFKTVNQQFGQYTRHPVSCALLLLDLDNFKSINDQHGHATGDKVICAVANTLTRHSRDSDICGRIGGEEFVVFLPLTDADSAHSYAERIRHDIEAQHLVYESTNITYTVSIGISELTANDTDIESMLKRADKALYDAKGSGRNQVKFSQH